MEAWLLVLSLFSNTPRPNIEMQNEDSCVLAAKYISQFHAYTIACINTFDGRVLLFYRGSQVNRPG